MQLSKKSWHYNLVKAVHGLHYFEYVKDMQRTISLCKYFWTVLSCVPLLPFVLGWRKLPYSMKSHPMSAQALIIWGFISYISAEIANYLHPDPYIWWLPIAVFFTGLGIIAFFAGIILVIYAIGDRLHDYLRRKRQEPKREHKNLGLVKEFAKARKQNICPCIDFVDMEVKVK